MGFNVDAGNTQRVPVADGETVTVTTRRSATVTAQSGLGLTPGSQIATVKQGSKTFGPYSQGYLTVLALGEPATVVNTPATAASAALAIKATRAQAEEGFADDVLSSPANVAQQIAATLPPSCRVVKFGTRSYTGVTTGTSADSSTAKPASDPVDILPLSNTSRLLVFSTLTVSVTAPTADNLINTGIYLWSYNGSAYVNFLKSNSIAVGGASSADLRIHGTATFMGELSQKDRRTDSNKQWTLCPHIASISGASWALTGGDLVFLEIDDADSITVADTVDGLVSFSSYGQSLGTGLGSVPVKTNTAVRAGRALMPVAGVRPLGNQTSAAKDTEVTDVMLKSFVNLFEQTAGSCGETPSSSAAWMLTGTSGLASYEAVSFVNNSIGGVSIAELSSGTVPYANMVKSIARTRVLARRNGLGHRAGGMFFTQGENNRSNSTADYLAYLVALQATLTADIRAIDQGTGEFPMFLDQLHNWPAYNITESEVPFAQLKAAMEFPGKFYLVGPKYMLQTVSDGVHLTADSSAWLGAYQGEIARRVLVLGEKWKPTMIESAVRTGASVLLTYNVPDGQLVIDTTLVTDPGSKGFRWIQTGGNSVTVTGVTIVGAKEIRLTLSAMPTGTNQQIGYADIGVSGAGGGPLTGPRGNVRDQAAATGLYGETLYNWAVVQRIAVS